METTSRRVTRVLATPGFVRMAEEHGTPEGIVRVPLKILTEALKNQPSEPSWVVIEPDLLGPQDEDGGRTRKLPGPFRHWVIRDDHPGGCECNCGGQSVVTFLLPEEY